MMWWHAAAWGLAGGAAAGLASLMTAVAKGGFTWPPKDELGPRLFVFTGTLLLGALVAAAMHASMSGAWPAFVMGAGAPATVRGLLAGVQISERVPTPDPASTPALASPAPSPTDPPPDVPPARHEEHEEGVSDGGR